MFHVAYFTSSDYDLRCRVIVQTGDAIEQLQFLVWPNLGRGALVKPSDMTVFNGLCTFALSNKSWVVGTLTFLLSLVRFAISITLYGFGRTGTSDPIYGCVEEIFITDAVFRAVAEYTNSTISAMNLVHVIIFFLSLDSVNNNLSLVLDLTDPMTSVMLSRFLFRVLASSKPPSSGTQSDWDDGETVIIAKFIGPLSSLGSSVTREDPLTDDDRTGVDPEEVEMEGIAGPSRYVSPGGQPVLAAHDSRLVRLTSSPPDSKRYDTGTSCLRTKNCVSGNTADSVLSKPPYPHDPDSKRSTYKTKDEITLQ
ncbi:hypothetical protein K466DRAFT_622875 [Polyporus arcularius HHB13444]|uniref:Uncharacterized protein n=1 Tax=Polyporus arcularius HHB13444 TaxID=1314778 RepID=A0A5C3P7P3_9APHY|nr:hypothetical protein K466DRAFT_622875 [Polyporus arcularius HHB13444]